MNVVSDLPIGNPPDEINVLIEIPRGSKNKYEVDKGTGLVTLDRVLYSSYAYPADYGMLPQTHWHDDDPLDALIINTAEPYYPGVVVPCRPIAVIRMVDAGEKDEKIICVPQDDPRLEQLKDKGDIAPHVLKEFTDFYENYKKLQGKEAKIEGIDGVAAAKKVIQEAVALYQKKIAG
ncbi:MAG TPA: inorganic diphosphatase [Patescibacteria group bacterium]|jgi:inorganic pyrophosphatase